MKERCLGRTGLRVSEIGLGGWPMGGRSYGPVRDADSLEALETAWDSGVNFFDTADVYGEGHGEELLGGFLKKKLRDRAVVATKGGWDFYQGAHKKNFGRDYLRSACEKSLKRLSVETIDLYQLHNPPLKALREEGALDILEILKREGKIRFIGVSVHTEAEALAALEDSRIHAIQVAFNLLDQRMAGNFFSMAGEKNAGVIVREPLASGILSGNYLPSHEFSKDDHRRRWLPEKRKADWQKVECLRKTLSNKKIALAQAALEFSLASDAVSTVIPGAKTRAQVLENVQASLRPRMDREDIKRLEEVYAHEEIFRKEMNPR